MGVQTSHKEGNGFALFLLVALNTVVLYGLVTTQRAEPDAWVSALTSLSSVLPPALAVALTGLLNSLLTPLAKARIVFWEWENPLPASRAFSYHLLRDPRINRQDFEARFGPLPLKPTEQNSRWYGLYRQVIDQASIVDASRSYLFARDCAGLLALMVPIFGSVALFQVRSPALFIAYTAVLIAQFAVAARAARVCGARLVTNVMAAVSTEARS